MKLKEAIQEQKQNQGETSPIQRPAPRFIPKEHQQRSQPRQSRQESRRQRSRQRSRQGRTRQRRSRRISQRESKRKRQLALNWHLHQDRRYELQTTRKINSFKAKLHNTYGFVADPSLPTWQNVQNVLLDMHPFHYFHRPQNKAVHILLSKSDKKKLPLGTIALLCLGLNFCIKKSLPTNNIDRTIKRLRKDIRREFIFAGSDSNYIPQLYLPNPDWNPSLAHDAIETGLLRFEN